MCRCGSTRSYSSGVVFVQASQCGAEHFLRMNSSKMSESEWQNDKVYFLRQPNILKQDSLMV